MNYLTQKLIKDLGIDRPEDIAIIDKTVENAIRRGYDMGWIASTHWSGSDHLISDIGSRAYTIEQDATLEYLRVSDH